MENIDEIINTHKWIKVKRFDTPDFKWNGMDTLPPFGALCEIVVKDHPPQNDTFEFVKGVGVSHDRPAFQWMGLNAMGLYEGAFFLDENLVTHWRISPYYLLEEHHVKETEFLIGKVRELAAALKQRDQLLAFLDYCDNAGWIKNIDRKRILDDYDKYQKRDNS